MVSTSSQFTKPSLRQPLRFFFGSKKRIALTGLGILLVLVAVVATLFFAYGLNSLFERRSGAVVGKVTWQDKGPVPLGEKKFTPQGLAWINGKLLFANCWKDERSRVYEIDPTSMKILRYFDMPAEAVHTSGLTWDGKRCWAVDYKSNRAYCLDLEVSFEKNKASVVGSFETTLNGTSACCMVSVQGRRYLAISDFMRTRSTIVVDHEKALRQGTAKDAIAWRYRNQGFSQGLEYADGFLYESENKWGIDVINKMDLKKLQQTKDAYKATVLQYPAPANGVEDLAWDGKSMWTSDEHDFRFYQGTFQK